MKLEFAKYTDVTAFAKQVNPLMFGIYAKVYICPDTNNWWLVTIQEGVNKDFDPNPDVCLVGRDRIAYPNYSRCHEVFLSISVARDVIENWDGSFWDTYEAADLEEAIRAVDGSYGIIAEEVE